MYSSRVFGGCRALMAAAKSTATKPSFTTAATGGTTPAAPKGILKVVPVSPALGEFLGGVPEASRTDAVKKIWVYIKANNLQNPADKRQIICDEKLKSIFDGKDKVGMLEIAKLLTPHFVKAA
ncbi:hypothetical protein MKW98_016761 [Papaver atlanticum]|uniref:DM2 domain-containing protein n=1 Tax=Papaver atlanticum TaxID=357466 RepID=A0AAD4XZ44_9MAGN|nr:hypothetical protein MKX03_020878 [Papaver bracteatum]KAI3960037.1 hypothetical protein MKW98_016761 [Papaver atlanticum]